MLLHDLLNGIYEGELSDLYRDLSISSISTDSRDVGENSLFVALKGKKHDGADFIQEATKKGAKAIVTSRENHPNIDGNNVCFLYEKDLNGLLQKIAGRFYGNPSSQLKTIGITGTNGKTTITYLIEAILKEAEIGCGVIGTVNNRIGELILPSKNTTPPLIDNQRLLSEMVNQGFEYCVLEVSSHALDQGRVDLIDFKTAVFTNLTHDHLDYHQTKEKYFAVKTKLFTNLSEAATSVINVDDVYGRKLISKTPSKVLTYGIENNADCMAKDIQTNISGTNFKLCFGDDQTNIRTKLVGVYNIYNILAAAAACLLEGLSLEHIKSAAEHRAFIPGRLESVDCQQDYSIFVDYAHTQDAFENVLRTIRSASDSKIIFVFGCGGDRDKTKRPEMGRVACALADFSIVTSDNPRSEDPQSIIDQIVEGFDQHNYEVIVNRQEAIQKALEIAQKDDIVLITGKGHETCQVFKDRTIKFDERQIIRQFLRC